MTHGTEFRRGNEAGPAGWPKSQSERASARPTIRFMTSITSPRETRRPDPRRRVRVIGDLLATMSIVQCALGLALLVAPAWIARLLAGMDPTTPETAVVLRVAGGFSLVIGAWCGLGRLSEHGIPRSRPLDLVPGLVVFTGCAVAVTANAILRGVEAPLLWPAWALYSILLVWSVACLALEREPRG